MMGLIDARVSMASLLPTKTEEEAKTQSMNDAGDGSPLVRLDILLYVDLPTVDDTPQNS
jgi:hypothetical protein